MSTAPPVYGARDSIAERTWPERGAAAGEAGDSERNLGGRKGGETGVRMTLREARPRGRGGGGGGDGAEKKKRPRARQGTKARRLARQPGDVRRSLFDGGGRAIAAARGAPREGGGTTEAREGGHVRLRGEAFGGSSVADRSEGTRRGVEVASWHQRKGAQA